MPKGILWREYSPDDDNEDDRVTYEVSALHRSVTQAGYFTSFSNLIWSLWNISHVTPFHTWKTCRKHVIIDSAKARKCPSFPKITILFLGHSGMHSGPRLKNFQFPDAHLSHQKKDRNCLLHKIYWLLSSDPQDIRSRPISISTEDIFHKQVYLI